MTKSRSLSVQGTPVTFMTRHEQDYISLTDMVKRFGDESVLYGWLRNRNTVEFLGVWELINNCRGQVFSDIPIGEVRSS